MKTGTKKRIIVSVTSDLASDNRVHKVCTTLSEMGFSVLLVGRELPDSLPLSERKYFTRRLKLLFIKGPLFYFSYNFRLFFMLVFSKFDLLLANDLDTLPANYLVSKWKNKPLVYDSHEYFTEVPELISRPRVKRIWEWMEYRMVPNLKSAYTVCDSIAKIYSEKFGLPFQVVQNLPFPLNTVQKKGLPASAQKMILYQGAINKGRGLEQAILAMKYIENAQLVIIGAGDLTRELKSLVEHKHLQNKVRFVGRLTLEELTLLTPQADIGLSIEEDLGLNYHFALPNKLFDYIQAHVPVLVTNLPEMAAVVKKYEVGEIITSIEPEALSKVISEMLTNEVKRKKWAENLKKASVELVWEKSEKTLRQIFLPFL